MRLLLIFLLIAYTTCQTNNYFYEIKYNAQYKVDIKKFYPLNYVPKANLYFIIPVENLNDTNVEIQIYKGDKKDFKVKVSAFYQHPTNSEIVNGTGNIELEQREVFNRYELISYLYRVPKLKKQEKIKYLVFTILNNEPMHYLSLYAYYDKEIEEEFTIYNVTYKKEEILNETTLSQHKGLFVFLFENGDLGKKN